VFGLPAATALLVFGFPAVWILYTIAFWVVSRNWDEEDAAGDDAP
jgi:hypothetical protein